MEITNKEWKILLHDFIEKEIPKITTEIISTSKGRICPVRKDIFKAIDIIDPSDVKIVLIGQDVYHTIIDDVRVAHGLAFSSNVETYKPPSLNNIFKEIRQSIYKDLSDEELLELNPDFYNVDLTRWARQGMLLINSALTTMENRPNSHKDIWKNWIPAILKILNNSKNEIAFIILGNEAAKHIPLIDRKHKIFRSGHPSPLNTKIPFLGTDIFLKVDEWYKQNYKTFKW